jgi:hypothetical protein
MWNMKDVYVANERYDDIRRTADKHNAVVRMGAQVRKERLHAQRSRKIWERMRKALR